jgi:hypothetical protein
MPPRCNAHLRQPIFSIALEAFGGGFTIAIIVMGLFRVMT